MNTKNNIAETQYLRVIGRLYPDNRLALRPSYLTDNSQNAEEDLDSSLVAELLDKEGRVLLRYHVPVRPYCADGQTFPELAVRGKIPFPSTTQVVRFYRDNVMLHEINVSEGKPKVRLTWDPPETVTGKQDITWVGEHPEQQSLQYFLRYSHTDGNTWQRVGLRTEKTTLTIDFDQLPGSSRCRIAVVATDGVNTVMESSQAFVVPIKPCKAMILAPEDGTTFALGEPITLQGQGFYLEENQAEIEALIWSSSVDGELGRGSILEVSTRSLGHHEITLRAGAGERVGEARISITISEELNQEKILS